MNILLVGNIASGKTTIAEALIKEGFITEKQFHSINGLRREYSDGTMAGEFFAWANMLELVQHPHPSGNSVFEFSGTGKNAWFFRECIKSSIENHNAHWKVVYCLADRGVLINRIDTRTPEVIPLPYKGLDPKGSLDFMGSDLQKKFGTNYWNAPEMTIRTDEATPAACVALILR